ncbi:hypothetical protein LIA77_00314 [Sarocladium implicatum]|nr:hypothetical protein LIA77_00314 [Sarocladium implicatum]
MEPLAWRMSGRLRYGTRCYSLSLRCNIGTRPCPGVGGPQITPSTRHQRPHQLTYVRGQSWFTERRSSSHMRSRLSLELQPSGPQLQLVSQGVQPPGTSPSD